MSSFLLNSGSFKASTNEQCVLSCGMLQELLSSMPLIWMRGYSDVWAAFNP